MPQDAKSRQASERAERKSRKKEAELNARNRIDKYDAALKTDNDGRIVAKLPPLFTDFPKRHIPMLRNLCEQKLENATFSNICNYIGHQQGAWLRDPKDWVPSSHNARRSLSSLLGHLMGTYYTPSWIEGLYDFADYNYAMELYPHISQGGKIKDFLEGRKVGPVLTKKQCHLLLNTPERMSLFKATRRAQVLSFDGTPRQVIALNESFLGREWQTDEDFWSTFIQWLAANPFISSDQISPMADYVRFLRRERPDFNMKGRTANRLYADMQIWHNGRLRSQRTWNGKSQFEPSGFRSLAFDGMRNGKQIKWCVVELPNQSALVKEGSTLRHCVASYGNLVANGRLSLWSLRAMPENNFIDVSDGIRSDPIVTIEVQNEQRSIVQTRGFGNRYPSADESRAINHWALQNNLFVHSR